MHNFTDYYLKIGFKILKNSKIISKNADLNYFSDNQKIYVNIDLYKYIFLISKQLENEIFIFLTIYAVSEVSWEHPPIK